MTREEQILKVGEEITSNPFELEGFIEGAEWADEHPQKKSKWSEADEELCQDTLDAFEALANDLNPSEDWGKLYDWLKSIKQRMEENK